MISTIDIADIEIGEEGRQDAGTQEDEPPASAPASAPSVSALDRLNGRQRKFVLAYCGEARLNAALAARMAGYGTRGNERFAGHQAKESPHVQAAIQELLDAAGGSDAETLCRISSRARGTMANVITMREDGTAVIDLQKAVDTGEIHNIKSIRHTKFGLAIELYDAQAADFKLLDHYRTKRLDELDAALYEEASLEASLNDEGTPGVMRHEVKIHYVHQPIIKDCTDDSEAA